MKDLSVVGVYENSAESKIEKFLDKIEASLKVEAEFKDIKEDTEWIEIIENTIPYIDNILRSPNRFIINEEEIVKVELARKITVDSIKHLSRNTNFIQDYNKETGDVRPAKILNINKEESYDTYENRLIYTLIQNIKIFIMKKKEFLYSRQEISRKETKLLEYKASTKAYGEEIDIDMKLTTKLDKSKDAFDEYEEITNRIKILERKITDVCSTDIYKILEKAHVALVRPPIKKTNVILKNVNFQYAMKLWDYLQDNMEDKSMQTDDKKNFSKDEDIRRMTDETFLLNYLLIDTLTEGKVNEPDIDDITREQLTNQLIERLINLNSDLTQEEILKLIGVKYEAAKEKNVINLKNIKDIFAKHIEKYLERVDK